MATENQNNYVKGLLAGVGCLQHDDVPVDHSTDPVKQGELVFWDGTAKLAKPVSSDAEAADLLGVAANPSAVSSSLDASSEPAIPVQFGGVFEFKTTASDTYDNGDLVYIGADAQTVTSTAGMMTSPVGRVRLPRKGSAITGAAGVNVQVLVFSRAWVKLAN